MKKLAVSAFALSLMTGAAFADNKQSLPKPAEKSSMEASLCFGNPLLCSRKNIQIFYEAGCVQTTVQQSQPKNIEGICKTMRTVLKIN